MQEEPNANEGRAQILEMLVAGRVTVEQAERLLAALGGASPAASQEPVNQTGGRRGRSERADDAFAGLTPAQLIALRDHGVSRAFVEQMRAAGLNDLSVNDLIELSDHGVDSALIGDLREAGVTNLTRDQLIALSDHGVDGAFARELGEAGFTNLAPRQLIALSDHGVDVEFIRRVAPCSSALAVT